MTLALRVAFDYRNSAVKRGRTVTVVVPEKGPNKQRPNARLF